MSTITVKELLPKPDEATKVPVEVKGKSIDFTTASPKTRREMARVVFGEIVSNLSDDDLKKYDMVASDINAKYQQHENKVLSETVQDISPEVFTVPAERTPIVTESVQNNPEVNTERIVIGAPSNFLETSEIESVIEEESPVVLSLREKAKLLLGAPNRGITKLYGKFFDKALKNNFKFTSMNEAEQQAHIEKVGRRTTVGAYAVAALGALYYSATKLNPADNFNVSSGNTYDSSHGDIEYASHTALSAEGSAGGSSEKPANAFNHLEVADFTYNPAEDPALSSAKHGNDFGPALVGDPMDAKLGKPGGTFDLATNRWPNSPGEFATVMSKLGLVDNDATAINDLADQMKDDPALYQKNYAQVIEMLSDPNTKIREETITGPYGSYYAVNNGNGSATIAYDNYVDKPGNRGTMIVIETADGHTIRLRKECGGQPIDIAEPKTQAPSQPASKPQANQPQYSSRPPSQPQVPVQPEAPNTPNTPSTPNTPETPTEPETPIVPEVPDIPVIPVVPDESKTDLYPDHPNLSTDLGPGEEMPVPTEVPIQIDTDTGRDIGGGTPEPNVPDTATNTPGTITGGQYNGSEVNNGSGLDTSGNQGSGNGVGSGDDAANTNTNMAESR